MQFHLLVEPQMSVADAHRICDVLTCDIEDHLPCTNVTIHVEPCDLSCAAHCREGCLLSRDEVDSARQLRH